MKKFVSKRVSSIDSGMMASAVSRPGIDSRIWLTLAAVEEVGFDEDEGVFIDVQFMPGGERETCFLGSPYSGSSFGDHCPVKEGETVLVAIPEGDPGYGPIIIGRFNDASDPPHSDFDSQNRVIRAEPGQNVKIVVSDGATLQIHAEGGSTIQLGGDTDSNPGINGVLNGEAIDPMTGKTHFMLGNASLTVGAKKGVS